MWAGHGFHAHRPGSSGLGCKGRREMRRDCTTSVQGNAKKRDKKRERTYSFRNDRLGLPSPVLGLLANRSSAPIAYSNSSHKAVHQP